MPKPYGKMSARSITTHQVSIKLPEPKRTHQHLYTIQCWKMIKINIFLRSEEAMLGTGESLSLLKI